jgi:hypothetical protein
MFEWEAGRQAERERTRENEGIECGGGVLMGGSGRRVVASSLVSLCSLSLCSLYLLASGL